MTQTKTARIAFFDRQLKDLEMGRGYRSCGGV